MASQAKLGAWFVFSLLRQDFTPCRPRGYRAEVLQYRIHHLDRPTYPKLCLLKITEPKLHRL
jgi:hypothetical protein